VNAPAQVDTRPSKPRTKGGAAIPLWIVNEITLPDGKRDISFKVNSATVPQEQRRLRNEVDRTLSALQVLFPVDGDQRFNSAFDKLLSLAQLGLVGDRRNPEIARDALKSLQAEIFDRESTRITNLYLRSFFLKSLIFCTPSIIVFLSSFWLSLQPWVVNIFLVWMACMFGTWVSIASRKFDLDFYGLVGIEESGIEPTVRLLFSGLVTLVLVLMLSGGLADLSLGQFHAASWEKSPVNALLLGAIAGIAERVLPKTVIARAEKAVASAGSS
jgi:hypothetical protein